MIAEAGVSRPTFYEYFSDRDDCFLTAVGDVQTQLLGWVRGQVERGAADRALTSAIEAVFEFAAAEPTLARFLTNEPKAGGPLALDARDRGIDDIERVIEERYDAIDPAMRIPDYSSRMLIGGVYRLLASRLRRGEPNPASILPDLIGWIASYEQPAAERRWHSMTPGPKLALSPFVPEKPLRAPEAPSHGGSRLPAEKTAENQRLRIMFAAARLAAQKGYNATTIGDITELAGVDGRAFYAMFADKQDAFMAVHELGFRRVMDVTAGAFFAGSSWPERNWEAGRAFTQFLDLNPLIANVGFVEAYAVGPGAVQRLEDSHGAFAMLLQDGYAYVGEDSRPSRIVLEAIVTTIFETVYHLARASERHGLAGLVPHFSFLVLSPFMGAEAANVFIDQKLAALAGD